VELKMKKFLILPDDLLEFMNEESYKSFINSLHRKNNIPEDEIIWIIG
jgi:hypothetical protein